MDVTALPHWDSTTVTAFAPDAASVKAAKKLARLVKWQQVGSDGYSAWGLYQGSGSTPYQVKLDLLKLQKGETGYHCSCPSRKQPCKHVIALLFMVVEQPGAIPVITAPEFVQEWLDRLGQRARKEQDRKKRPRTAEPEATAVRAAQRVEKIDAGFAELEVWLLDLMRQGLGDPQLKSYAFWEGQAARMVDAQAPGIGGWLRALGSLPGRSTDWADALLSELGRLYLFIKAFQRFDALPPPMQADLRAVAGWHVRREELAALPAVRDRWLVLGRRVEAVDTRLRQQRIWLRGAEQGRFALILEFAFGDAPFDTHLLPGAMVDASLVFYPGATPLRALIRRQHGPVAPLAPAGSSIDDNLKAYARALGANPWLLQFPFLLDEVWPQYYSSNWIVREAGGSTLPLSSLFRERWPLMALSGGRPLQLAGEWDGSTFYPTAALTRERLVDLSGLETR